MSALSIGDAWEEAKAVFTADRQRIVPVALGLVMLPAAMATWLSGLDESGQMRELPPYMVLVTLLLILLTLTGQLTIARLALHPAESVGEAMRLAARRIWPVLGMAMLVFTPLIFVVMALGVNPDGSPKPMTPGVTIAMVAVILVILFLAVRLSLSSAIAAAEAGGPVALIRRSFALTKGNSVRLGAYFLLLLTAALLVSWAVGVVAGLLVAFGEGAVEPMSLEALFLGLVQGAIEAGLVITAVLMLTALYRQAVGAKG